MRAAQEAVMMDACVRLAYGAPTTDTYNLPESQYTPQSPIACGFDPTASKEVMSEGQVVVTDGQMRLPVGTTVDSRDRFQVTHRHGEALASPPTFELIGDPERGPSGLVLNLRLVTDGSDE
jgi:hypothetical protein